MRVRLPVCDAFTWKLSNNHNNKTMRKKKNSLSATVGTALLSLLLLALSALPAAAQQLPNPGFENWVDCVPWTSKGNTKKTGMTPQGWCISHVVGMSGTGATVVGNKEDDDVNVNNTVAYIYNTNNPIMQSEKVPGYMTLGTTWSTAESKIFYTSKKDGGTFGGIKFVGRPDAVEFKYKRDTENVSEAGNVIVYAWKGSWTQQDVPGDIALGATTKTAMVDRDRNVVGMTLDGCQGGSVTSSDDASCIFKLDSEIGFETNWTTFSKELEYTSDEDPENINVIFSANGNYWSNVVKEGNGLHIDGVKLIYYSQLNGIKIAGTEIANFTPDNYNYYVAELPEVEDVEAIPLDIDSNLYDVEEPILSADGKKIEIKVTSNGPSKSVQTYTIQSYTIDIEDDGEEFVTGGNCSLTAVSIPADALDGKLVEWVIVSDNKDFATIEQGTDSEKTFIFTTTEAGDYTVRLTVDGKSVEKTVSVIYENSKTVDYVGNITVESNGSKSVFENVALQMNTVSGSKCQFVIPMLQYHGMRIKDVKISGVSYVDNNGYKFSSVNSPVTANVGAETIIASIEDGSFANGNEITITAAMTIDWGNGEKETATVVFSTDPIVVEEKDPSVVSHYPGSVIITVVKESENSTEEFEMPLTVSIFETEDPAIVWVRIPSMKFKEDEWMDWNRSKGTGIFLYSLPEMTIKDVKASKSGEITTYSREQSSYLIDNKDYFIGLNGSVSSDGVLRMIIELKDPISNTDMSISFKNSDNVGDVYDGTLTVEMGGSDMTNGGQAAKVEIIPDVTGEKATFILPDFKLESLGLDLGSIIVNDVDVVSSEDGLREYTGSVKGMKLPGDLGVADVDLEGCVDAEGVADMLIIVMWNGQPINVHFTGNLNGESSGVEPPVVDGGVVDGPAEYYTIGGVRVNGESLAPGLYIERRGNQVRKILVK